MKIKEINQTQPSSYIYQVTLIPNWLEKLFGVKEKVVEFKDTSNVFTFGGGHVYRDKQGKELRNGNWIGEAIDQYRRSW